MLQIYRIATGEVVDGGSTNQLFPEGAPDPSPMIQNVIELYGGTKDDYGILRLHDVEDAEIVDKIFTHEYTIQDGQVIFGDRKPILVPEPKPPSEIEKLRIETAQANAEMFEMLLMMTGGST